MREIFLCDLNNFYASCEVARNKNLASKPVAVSGSVEDRKGVVIACNYLAKDFGVRVGDLVFEAKNKCPKIKICECDFELYNHYSKKVREIYLDFTDRVEPFSIDECFLDVTNSKIFGTSQQIAEKIKEKVKKSLNLTLSIGISFNKTFAKIASEFKKPDAISIVTKEDFKQKIWTLDVSKMIGVGKRLEDKLKRHSINTIGDLANVDEKFISKLLGKVGRDLKSYACGFDFREVELYSNYTKPKSVGNGTTFYRDLSKKEDLLLAFSVISDSIVARMMKYGLNTARTLKVYAKYNDLSKFSKQVTFPYPTRNSTMIWKTALETFYKFFPSLPVRQLGLKVSNFDDGFSAKNFFETKQEKDDIDKVVLSINKKMNKKAIFRGNALLDKKIAESFDKQGLEKKGD
ncbi:MAG: DNA polymerase IV [Christensenellales bacterium]